MINFMKLNRTELLHNGLIFETVEEAELFAQIVLEELEVRIGAEISNGLDCLKLAELDACTTQAESQAWLEKNRPDYREIVKAQSATLDQEIMALRERIPGLIAQDRRDFGDWPIEELGLGIRSLNCLKRAGLKTVRDILSYGDLSRIRNLSRSCVEEIGTAINSLTDKIYSEGNCEYSEEEFEAEIASLEAGMFPGDECEYSEEEFAE